MENINYGIDLGTTNSGLGKYENGKVQVLKNPVGLHEILPSVVAFYRGRTLVGSKAREQYLTNTGNVFGAFKRKMGTAEKYLVKQQDKETEVSPVDLSAYVLKELKGYVQNNDLEEAVITIPASFDTIQSNATKNAGYQAGLKEVVLLQEPVAACLAYANLSHLNIEKDQKWLVYDFGGGTFDVALVHINQRELKVIDNKGNNFLGGVDIDNAFLQQIIVPALSKITGLEGLWGKMLRKENLYDKLWHYLSYLAEEAKKQLSVAENAWIEVNFAELDIFTEFEVSRNDLDLVVRPKYLETERFVLEVLSDNNLSFNDIERVILVGGTTYIPSIRAALQALSHAVVDVSIDPTTAIIVGAAYYAGACPRIGVKEQNPATNNGTLNIKLSFEAYSNDHEELIAFKTETPFTGFYRVTRNDGGFDSGQLAFTQTASEFVSLLPKTRNDFKLRIFNAAQGLVYESSEIAISQGLYSVSGQLLPQDICIELDNNKEHNTYLEVIFKRNSILPLSKTLYRTFSKSIIKGSDDKVIINVVEGKSGTMPGSNLSIGFIELSGQKISSDLIQGTDIEIQVSMDESRGLKVDLYIPATEEQISHSFHIASRDISVDKMLSDIAIAETVIKRELEKNDKAEAYELSVLFKKIEKELLELKVQLELIIDDHVTEEKYRLEEQKRSLISALDSLTRSRDVFLETQKYQYEKTRYLGQEACANEFQKQAVQKLFIQEKEMLKSGDKHFIKRNRDDLTSLNNKIWMQNIENLIIAFWNLLSTPKDHFRNTDNWDDMLESGKMAIANKDLLQLRGIVIVLYNNLHERYQGKMSKEEHIQNIAVNQGLQTGLK